MNQEPNYQSSLKEAKKPIGVVVRSRLRSCRCEPTPSRFERRVEMGFRTTKLEEGMGSGENRAITVRR